MSSRTRKRHQRSQGSVGKKILLGFGVILVVIGIAAGAAAGWVYDKFQDAPSIDQLKPLSNPTTENSEIFAADGSPLGVIDADITREPVGLKAIPGSLQEATIAIEDENFYEHSGVDFSAILRAAIKNAEAGEIEQGASTITQQLVRNLYLKKPEDTLERKLQEAKMAMDYEDKYSKDEILEEYLNTATYGTNGGDTAVGVEAASQTYFNKHVSDLNLGEAALLAGLPQAPSQYNPFLNADAATARRNLVLKAMLDQDYISRSEFTKWSRAGLGLEPGTRYEFRRYQYFFDFVQQELVDKYGTATTRLGGLEVTTTLQPRLQDIAQQSINNRPYPPAAAALVSTNVDTGEIQAMASSSSYEESKFNLAAQGKRQPGSSFKAFALTAAVDQGIDPDTTYYKAPTSITLPSYVGGPPDWDVSGGAGGGTISLRDATANSVNTVYAQLVLDITPDAMDEMAHKMGITTELFGYPSEVLGTIDVSVLEMSNAYATLANGGVHHDPTAISRVEFPNGDVDELDPSSGTRAVSDGVAYTVADVMKGALEYGTAAGQGIGCPASGKTGTTESNADAWFVGYTPHVSTAVWVGNPTQRIPLPGYGADLAAPIWHDYMAQTATEPCDDFPEPKDPVDLSSASSGYAGSSDLDDSTTDETTDETTDLDDADNDGYDDDLYNPGTGDQDVPGDDGGGGQGPRPPANPGNGNGNPGGGNPGGGNPGGGGGPGGGGIG
ncbi:MAG: penicillin-binding protein [Solirubrobacterales bacterium]|jgi:penicillin-binding protein 1A|nr:penicillin-binding protein [Solirubrobacterales bacterium]